jgi:hypothetical protein
LGLALEMNRGKTALTIKKLVSVKYVGRLVDCAQKGPELSKHDLFFAKNGRGKTTLCAVLRSLQTGEHQHITERKTIGPISSDPSATVRLDFGNATYGKKGGALYKCLARSGKLTLCLIHAEA